MIVGLAGPAGVGKDTVADILTKSYGYKKASFAGPLKAMLAELGFPEPAREHKEALIPGFPFSWRQAAQTLGTEWGRALDPDLWIKVTLNRLLGLGGNWVISDCRFPNEAGLIRQHGVVVHITGRATTIAPQNANHASEQPLTRKTEDIELDNSGSMAQLAWNVGCLQAALAKRENQ